MSSVMNKLNALDSVMKLKRQWDLLRWLGGPSSVVRRVCACGGCQLKWRKKKKEKTRVKGVTSALSEIWDRAIFQSLPFSIKEENHENQVGEESRKHGHIWRGRPEEESSLRLSAGGSVEIDTACTVLLLSCARACVFTSVWTSATNEGKKEDKAKEGGMVDNSGSSKAQMVSRGPCLASLFVSLTCGEL